MRRMLGRLLLGQVLPTDDQRLVIINKNNPINSATCSVPQASGGGGGGGIGELIGPLVGGLGSAIGGGAGLFGDDRGNGYSGSVGYQASTTGQAAPGITTVGQLSGCRRKVNGRIGVSPMSPTRLLRGVRVAPQSPVLSDVTGRNLVRSRQAIHGLGYLQTRPTFGRGPRITTNRLNNMPRPRMGDQSDDSDSRDRGTTIINKIFPITNSTSGCGQGGGGGGGLPWESLIPAVAGQGSFPNDPPPPPPGNPPPPPIVPPTFTPPTTIRQPDPALRLPNPQPQPRPQDVAINLPSVGGGPGGQNFVSTPAGNLPVIFQQGIPMVRNAAGALVPVGSSPRPSGGGGGQAPAVQDVAMAGLAQDDLLDLQELSLIGARPINAQDAVPTSTNMAGLGRNYASGSRSGHRFFSMPSWRR